MTRLAGLSLLLLTTFLAGLATADPVAFAATTATGRAASITAHDPITFVSINSTYLHHTATPSSSNTVVPLLPSSSSSSTGGGPASATPTTTSTSTPANSNSGTTQSIGAGKAVVALVGALAGAMLCGL